MNVNNQNKYYQIFKIFDTNQDGHISMSEFQKLLNKFGIIRNKNEVLNMMKIIDKDGNNQIEYKEIIDFLNNCDSYKNENEDAICDAFYIIDNSKKGYITLTDLLFYIRKIGLDLSYNTIIEDFQFEDKNKNEKIDLNEFRYMVLRKDSFTNFKIIAELLIFVDKVEIKSSLNSIYPVSEEVINISLFLKNFNIFSNLPRGRLYKICKNVIVKKYQYREKICDMLSIFNYLYIIFSGEVSIEIKTTTFNYTMMCKGCGYIIGLEELRDNKKKYNYSYYPKTNTTIYKIPISIIKDMMKIDKVFNYRIITHLDNSSTIPFRKLKKIDKKKTCSFSNFGKKLDNTLGQKQVLDRIKFLEKKKKI